MVAVDIPITEMSFPTRMIVGPDAATRLPAELEQLGVRRALIVADPGLQQIGLVGQIESILSNAGLTSAAYLGVSKNPVEKDVLDGVKTYRQVGADVVIGLGGGASMDVAKAIRLKTTHELDLEYYDDLKDGWKKIHGNQPPMIAIPTTAGTGSEVGRASVICLGDVSQKVVIFSAHMMPNVAILDAKLSQGLPPAVTAATGIDALTHAIEAYVAKGTHPFADMYALAAISRISIYLERAVRDGKDLQARHEMLLAASMGAIAFQKGLGACHALAHPLSAVAGLHHGLANALMLSHVIRFNMGLPEILIRYSMIAKAMGVGVDRASHQIGARACLERVQTLVERVGLPGRLSDVGVTEEHIQAMVPQAVADACAPQNPRKLTESAALALYEAAL